jgi:hypothetical protein
LRSARLILIIVSLPLCFTFIGPAVEARGKAIFRAGAATVDITPEVSARRTPMAGYINRFALPAKGVHDPVHCKALVVSDGSESAAVISCDLVTISKALRDKVVEKLSGTAFHDDNILLAATHTHSGPGGYDKNLIFQAVLFGAYDDEFTEWMAEKIAAAVRQADAGGRPAVIRVAETELASVNINRRYGGGYNYSTRRSEDTGKPGGLIDPALTVIRIDSTDGAPIAVLFHFATHATILGADNMLISADWPGVAMARIEAGVPGAKAMFLNGAEGDQTPKAMADGSDDRAWVEKIGTRVGNAVLDAMDEARPVRGVPVAAAITRRAVQGRGRIMALPLSARATRALFPAMPLQAMRIGEIALLAIPLEMTAVPGMTLKASARSETISHPLVVGLANDFYWYCAGPDELKNGSAYEPGNTIFKEIEAGLVIGEELMLLRRILP